MTKIAVVEDDESIQKLITYALTANGYEAQGFGDGQSFLNQIEDFQPELVLLDVMMPGIDGIEVLRCLRRSTKFRDLPVMMLTAKSAETDKVSALDLGADDYMTKPFGVMEMLSRVKALLRRTKRGGGSGAEEETVRPALEFREITLDESKHRVRVKAGDQVLQPELTLKEFELLDYMMHNQELVLTRDQIMGHVWNYDYEGESRTIDMHVKTLRQKLGDAGQYIKTVRGIGYRLSAD
ncbi:MAG TPA: DNA-binding response regulator [Oribacterium sp.]|nr:DNA-binding response regulator [Oribacterium sp.]HCS67486.1 DNA-binding response regulator [Oribacterium sp.]